MKGPYQGMMKALAKGDHFSYCVPCKKDVKVKATGLYDLKSLISTLKHTWRMLRLHELTGLLMIISVVKRIQLVMQQLWK